MAKGSLETIVLKQLASCLAMPMLVMGPEGDLLYFNEPAEGMLGRRFDETGALTRDEWVDLLHTTDDHGRPLEPEERPMVAALNRRAPSHTQFWVRTFDGRATHVETTTIPLLDLKGELFGALGFFWELDRPTVTDANTPDIPVGVNHHPVETILTRRFAASLATPIFLVGFDGRLLYFNTAAGSILGMPFEEIVATSREQINEAFQPRDEHGRRIGPDEHPLWIARVTRAPVHGRSVIRGLDGVSRTIEVTAIPLVGQSGRVLGAFGVFWETETA